MTCTGATPSTPRSPRATRAVFTRSASGTILQQDQCLIELLRRGIVRERLRSGDQPLPLRDRAANLDSRFIGLPFLSFAGAFFPDALRCKSIIYLHPFYSIQLSDNCLSSPMGRVRCLPGALSQRCPMAREPGRAISGVFPRDDEPGLKRALQWVDCRLAAG